MDGDGIALAGSMLINVGLWASIFYKMGKVETESKHVTGFLKQNCPHCQDVKKRDEQS